MTPESRGPGDSETPRFHFPGVTRNSGSPNRESHGTPVSRSSGAQESFIKNKKYQFLYIYCFPPDDGLRHDRNL